jgi:uncharacterized protein (TIRG00374 family)
VDIGKRHVAAGILTWTGIVGVLVLVAGPTEFVASASDLSRTRLLGLLLLKAIGTISMGLVLYTVSRGAGLNVSPVESIFLNATISCVNNFTPFGQASGLPVGGLIISKWTGHPFEKGVAALSTKELVGFTPGILVMLFGGSYIVLSNAAIPERVRSLVAVFTLSIATFVLVLIFVYRDPAVARRQIRRFVAALNHRVDYLPRISKIDEAEIHRRVDGFTESIGQISSNRSAVVVAATLTTIATTTQGVLLWVALGGVGVHISPALAIFIVPVSLLASAVPTPGGTGGIEGAQILLLLAVSEGNRSTIITAVVLTRGLVYWTPIVIGSLTLAGIQFRKWWLS